MDVRKHIILHVIIYIAVSCRRLDRFSRSRPARGRRRHSLYKLYIYIIIRERIETRRTQAVGISL